MCMFVKLNIKFSIKYLSFFLCSHFTLSNDAIKLRGKKNHCPNDIINII